MRHLTGDLLWLASTTAGWPAGVDRVIDLLVAAGLDPAEHEHGLRRLHAALAPGSYGPGYAETDRFNESAALALIRQRGGAVGTSPTGSEACLLCRD